MLLDSSSAHPEGCLLKDLLDHIEVGADSSSSHVNSSFANRMQHQGVGQGYSPAVDLRFEVCLEKSLLALQPGEG